MNETVGHSVLVHLQDSSDEMHVIHGFAHLIVSFSYTRFTKSILVLKIIEHDIEFSFLNCKLDAYAV